MKYRTFVKLDSYERWILRVVQNMPRLAGRKTKLPAGKIIGGIIREYFDALVQDSDPEMLKELLRLGPPCPNPLNDNVIQKLQESPEPSQDPAGGQAQASGRPS